MLKGVTVPKELERVVLKLKQEEYFVEEKRLQSFVSFDSLLPELKIPYVGLEGERWGVRRGRHFVENVS